jgi:hypothetical protein
LQQFPANYAPERSTLTQAGFRAGQVWAHNISSAAGLQHGAYLHHFWSAQPQVVESIQTPLRILHS